MFTLHGYSMHIQDFGRDDFTHLDIWLLPRHSFGAWWEAYRISIEIPDTPYIYTTGMSEEMKLF
jgi:hypothetical protein